MTKSISRTIYEAFFTRLSELSEVRPETVEHLRRLYNAGRLDKKPQVSRMVKELEDRHAQDQESCH